MDKKPASKNLKQQSSSQKKETRSRGGNSGKPEWMTDPKKAAISRARSRNLRGCYSVGVIIVIVIVVVGMIYVTIR
jgi:hypothetical protein